MNMLILLSTRGEAFPYSFKPPITQSSLVLLSKTRRSNHRTRDFLLFLLLKQCLEAGASVDSSRLRDQTRLLCVWAHSREKALWHFQTHELSVACAHDTATDSLTSTLEPDQASRLSNQHTAQPMRRSFTNWRPSRAPALEIAYKESRWFILSYVRSTRELLKKSHNGMAVWGVSFNVQHWNSRD